MKWFHGFSLAVGGAYALLFAGIHGRTGWPSAWFGPVAGATIGLGLVVGLAIARRRRDPRPSGRLLFVATGLVAGATGLLGLFSPSRSATSWADWLSLAIGILLLAAAASPRLWIRHR